MTIWQEDLPLAELGTGAQTTDPVSSPKSCYNRVQSSRSALCAVAWHDNAPVTPTMTQTESPSLVSSQPKKPRFLRQSKKMLERLIPLGLMAYFIPKLLIVYVIAGMIDVFRNRPLALSTLNRYFFGNGNLTWFLAPFNLLMDLFCLPYWNKGIFQLTDLPKRYQSEIQTLIDAAHSRNLVSALESKMGEKKRGMFFFQWYGKLIQTSLDIPEFQTRYKYIRTIGVSIFNKKQSTGKHYGPLRVTYRVLYNINTIDDPNVYVGVGNHIHRWRDGKLFIFDDTLQHDSHNESDAVRYCLFVDILRPSLVPWLLGSIVTAIRLMLAPVRRVFYKHWTMIK
jgi:beta-hydroxylase